MCCIAAGISAVPPTCATCFLQYAPWLGMKVLKRVGPARARALRAGKSGYDMSLLQEGGEEGGASKPA